MDTVCPMCLMRVPSNALNLHLGDAHKNEANFRVTCDIPGCNRAYDNWKSYRQHNWRTHHRNIRDLDNVELRSSSESDPDDFEEIPDHEDFVEAPLPDADQPRLFRPFQPQDDMTAPEKLKYKTALFVASLRENSLIPQTTISSVLEGVCELVEDYLQITKDSLIGDDTLESIPAEAVKEAFRNCQPSSIFEKCAHPRQIMSFMEEKLNRVDAEKVCIGKQHVWSETGQLVGKECFAYIPPFLRSLQLCLNNPDILHCVDNPLPHEEGVLRSVLDAHYYRTHDVVLNDPNTLAFEIQ